MAVPLSLGPVHHLRLTVTDVDRSRVSTPTCSGCGSGKVGSDQDKDRCGSRQQ